MNKLLLNMRKKIMAFRDMFKDDNDINEKNASGVSAVAVLLTLPIPEIVSGWMGYSLTINKFIYN